MAHPLRAGLYDVVIDGRLQRLIDELGADFRADVKQLDPADVPDRVSRLFRDALRAGLTTVQQPGARAALLRQVRNVLAAASADLLEEGELQMGGSPSHLLEVRPARVGLGETEPTRRPVTPLADSALLMNAPGEPALAQELQAELSSADRVDLLIAFVKWSGIRLVREPIEALIARGGRLRVLTTTYTGASDANALAALARWGAEVRISFDNRRTRLHAKSWIFHRDSGATTAYIGSSNLSSSAMLDGLEWNVRLAALESPTLLEKISAAFEAYWESEEFRRFDPDDADEMDVVRRALESARGGSRLDPVADFFDLKPYPFQQAILDTLASERERGHRKTLVVAPTGVGKTMVAAFDYARMEPRPRLLFVAHRERLLDQSLTTFRHVLREGDFGEKLVGGHVPHRGDHVFASIQSLHSRGWLEALDPEHYDFVIIDEFHHAEAPTYERLLEHVTPRYLVGLTATPERHDGRDVRRWFDGRTSYEMRLGEALELGLLAPFHYFGIHDDVDLDHVRFSRGRYHEAELSQLYTGNDARARLVLEQVHRIVGDADAMRALGFCVSVEHARFMARRFSEAGLASVAVTGEATREERRDAIRRLERGDLKVLFTVDLFNEGVDIPSVDTVLFLRPTESATVFLQQLGRGLRIHPDKSCLTVLDFIGNAHADVPVRPALPRARWGEPRSRYANKWRKTSPSCLQAAPCAWTGWPGRSFWTTSGRSPDRGSAGSSRNCAPWGRIRGLGEFLEKTGTELVELYTGRDRSFTTLKHRAFGGPEIGMTNGRGASAGWPRCSTPRRRAAPGVSGCAGRAGRRRYPRARRLQRHAGHGLLRSGARGDPRAAARGAARGRATPRRDPRAARLPGRATPRRAAPLDQRPGRSPGATCALPSRRGSGGAGGRAERR